MLILQNPHCYMNTMRHWILMTGTGCRISACRACSIMFGWISGHLDGCRFIVSLPVLAYVGRVGRPFWGKFNWFCAMGGGLITYLARSRTGIWSPLFGHARREAGCPAVGGLVRIVWFFGQFRSLVRPGGRAWLMLRLGPLDSGVWLFAGICFLYKARLRRKPSLATCRIDRIWGYSVSYV